MSLQSTGVTKLKQNRCVYLCARVELLFQLAESAGILGEVVAFLVKVGKDHQGTLDQVTLGAVSLHWGLLGLQAGAALKAVTAALQMVEAMGSAAYTLPPAHRKAVRLQIAVSYGAVASATVNAAGHSYFVVGGTPVDLASRVVGDGIPEQMGCSVLVTEAVRREVQYSVACSPRLWVAETLWFQPTHLLKGGQDDEWMYQLQRVDASDARSLEDALLGLLRLARAGASIEVLRREASRVRDQFGPQLTNSDLRTLAHLCGGFLESKPAPQWPASLPHHSRPPVRRSFTAW
eukprot:EG_transcript_9174